MFTALGLFFSSLLKTFLSLVSGVLNWIRENPKLAAVIALCVLIGVCAYLYGKRVGINEGTAAHQATIDSWRAEVDARNKRISELEGLSTILATEAEKLKNEKTAEILSIQSSYEARLKDAEKNQKIIRINVPVPMIPGAVPSSPSASVTMTLSADLIIENGVVACRRLPSAHVQTINDMVKKANEAKK
jgi:hypothetical protein